uniref:Si:dkey-188g12.1 n=1 Tax=Lepisosteus oculatus TaxID=7918 RepID=W5M604_LEPOC
VDHAGNMDVLVQGNSEEQEERLYSSELRDIERYSLGNQLRYGYFGRDASTQTDVIELPRVKELSEVTCTLLEDMKAVKSDLEYKHKFLQTDYEEKLQQHSLFLYMRINEKVLDLERQHKEKVAVLRKSFQQQLCDGLAVLRASYKKYYSRKEEKDQSSGSTKAGRLHELINEVQEKNAMIDYLSAQLKEYETSLQPYEDPEKELLAHENEKLKDEIDTLHVDIERLSDCLDCKDKQLGLSLQTMKEKAENDQITINKLVAENENLKRDLHVEKDAGRSK